MSIKRTTAVWAQSSASGAQLLLLLALADMAKDDGLAWASVSTLAKRVRVSVREVSRLVDKLERSGELIVVRRPGRHSFYIVTVGLADADRRAALQRLATYIKTPVELLERELNAKPVGTGAPLSPMSGVPLASMTGVTHDTNVGGTPDIHDRGTPVIHVTPDMDVTPVTGVWGTPDTHDGGTPDIHDTTPLTPVSPVTLYEPLQKQPLAEPSRQAVAAPKNGAATDAAAAQPEPAVPAVSGKKPGAAKKPKPADTAAAADKPSSPLVAIIDAYWSELPAPPAGRPYARYMRAAKRLHDAGYTAEQVAAYVRHVYKNEWWRGKALTLEKVAEQLPSWLADQGSDDDTIEYTTWHEPTATPQEMYEALTLEGKLARARRIRQQEAARQAALRELYRGQL